MAAKTEQKSQGIMCTVHSRPPTPTQKHKQIQPRSSTHNNRTAKLYKTSGPQTPTPHTTETAPRGGDATSPTHRPLDPPPPQRPPPPLHPLHRPETRPKCLGAFPGGTPAPCACPRRCSRGARGARPPERGAAGDTGHILPATARLFCFFFRGGGR